MKRSGSAGRVDLTNAPKVVSAGGVYCRSEGMVSQDGLGLFDTPPERRDIRSAVAVVALLSVALLAVLPFTNARLPEVTAFVPVANSIMFVGDLIVASLLYAQASLFRSRHWRFSRRGMW
jgi:hypothetical protein